MNNKTGWTHVEDVKDPDEVLLDDLPLHLGHGSAIETLVRESFGVCVICLTQE